MNSTGDVWVATILAAVAAVLIMLLVVALAAVNYWIHRNKKDSDEPH